MTTLFLLQRKGFVRLALRSGAELVPVFIFHEKCVSHRTATRAWLCAIVLRRPLRSLPYQCAHCIGPATRPLPRVEPTHSFLVHPLRIIRARSGNSAEPRAACSCSLRGTVTGFTCA